MPIEVDAETRPLSQEEFGRRAYEVMDHIFRIHNELGPFLNERIYARAISQCDPRAVPDVRVHVRFESFSKPYILDLLVDGGAIFELKNVRTLNDRHRSQLLNYLLLTELPRGKLVNLRPAKVDHEFLNTTLQRDDRITFDVMDSAWDSRAGGHEVLHGTLIRLLRDVGTGLDVVLYEEAAIHFLGGLEAVVRNVEIRFRGQSAGCQKFRLATPATAFKIISLRRDETVRFEEHARRLLSHTELDAIQWVNINLHHVTFQTIRRK